MKTSFLAVLWSQSQKIIVPDPGGVNSQVKKLILIFLVRSGICVQYCMANGAWLKDSFLMNLRYLICDAEKEKHIFWDQRRIVLKPQHCKTKKPSVL